MKKIVLIVVALVTLSNASWLNSNEKKGEPMLQSTLFKKFESKIGKEPFMVEFGSVSCYSCQIMGKTLYKIKQKYPQSNIYFLDIYKDMPTAKKFGIRMIPTQKYFDKDGNIIDTHMGIIEQEKLVQKLKNLKIIKK